MRGKMETLFKEELRILAIRTRAHLNITQKEMANKLEMSESSYSDIETGRIMCGTLTTTLLFAEQEDPQECLERLKIKLKKLYEEELQPI